MADLYDIGFKDIYNAPSGGKSLEDIVKSMYEVIRDSGKFGTGDDARDRSLSDIDNTMDDYVKYFKTQYIRKFPIQLASDSDGNVVDEKTR